MTVRRITALDPGGTTGLATYGHDGLSAMQGSPDEILDQLEYSLKPFDWDERPDIVVCESFTISMHTLKKSRGGSNAAIETIGAARYLCRRAGVPFRLQSPGEAKGFASDSVLRRVRWLPGLPDHARDAARHLLLACVTEGLIPAEHLLPPEETGTLTTEGGSSG
mgnify:CR=1 FL=1